MTAHVDLADGTYTAVVDSIEDGLATVFLEDDGDEVGNAVIDATALPDDGQHADAVLSVTVADGELVEWDYDAELTSTRREQAQDRFDRLSERPPSDKDE
ncbi:DUF3006 domain-containing protein [Haloarcula salinisoli]|uniref:DUF3006 domain-containing protein n=1 Tax=Haloarcula salinisoli TaxID=2487746 RepID=A0A8J7YL40_9EURY|nr:DUF3006 domain-containing protein [Halomicroarcula salinisoli]MBX0305718.1 DUF3006 domain-containing protein [Halomicroarcula salinisoli]